jgi:GNAT superfamily N-acetyltransferase
VDLTGTRIRSIKKEDFDQWLPLWERYNVFYKREVSLEITQETWRRFFDPQEPVFALVAEEKDKVIGFVHYLFHRHTAKISYSCYLQDLFTLESERGKGVGRSLIEAVSKKAQEAGTGRIYWLTHETNQNARKLYDKVATNTGFIVYLK